MKQVNITIDKTGKINCDGEGFVGTECEAFIAKFAALGEVEEQQYKEEYYMDNYLTTSEGS